MILYHGNQDREMVPQYGGGNKNNDYGQGFYTTADIELAKEWAYSGYNKSTEGHWLHTYEIDLDKCNVYYLNDDDIMCWLSQLYTHRDVGELGEVQSDRLVKFQDIYYKDLSGYDIIVGWRADDSYFRYAQDFLNGVIYRSTLEEAIRLGNLGIQYFIQSEKAFDELNRIGEPIEVEDYYRNKYVNRDRIARNEYQLKAKNVKYDSQKETIDMILSRY